MKSLGHGNKITSNHAAGNSAKLYQRCDKMFWALLSGQLANCAVEVCLEVNPRGGGKQTVTSRELV